MKLTLTGFLELSGVRAPCSLSSTVPTSNHPLLWEPLLQSSPPHVPPPHPAVVYIQPAESFPWGRACSCCGLALEGEDCPGWVPPFEISQRGPPVHLFGGRKLTCGSAWGSLGLLWFFLPTDLPFRKNFQKPSGGQGGEDLEVSAGLQPESCFCCRLGSTRSIAPLGPGFLLWRLYQCTAADRGRVCRRDSVGSNHQMTAGPGHVVFPPKHMINSRRNRRQIEVIKD